MRGLGKRGIAPTVLCLAALLACGCATPPVLDGDGGGLDAGRRPDAATTDVSVRPDVPPDGCDPQGLRGPGRHRLFVQGREAPPRADGTWPLLHEVEAGRSDARLCDDEVFMVPDDPGHWTPGVSPGPFGPSALVHGEHFLAGRGSYVEFTMPLCDDITGRVVFYIPNFDVAGSVALHQLLIRRGDTEQLIAEVTDDEPGSSGYNPFVRQVAGTDPDARPGDTLVLRSVNVSGASFSVMVWRPPSEYESWIVVEVP